MKAFAARIQNLTDARYFAAKGADFLSFCVEEGQEGHIDPMAAKAIKEWVEGPACFGDFDLFSPEAIRETVDFLGLDGAVAGPGYGIADLEKLAGLRLLRAIEAPSLSQTAELEGQILAEKTLVEAFVLDLLPLGLSWDELLSPAAGHLDRLAALAAAAPVFLKMPFEPRGLAGALKKIRPSGLALTGGEEERVGVKSFDELDDIFDAIEGLS